MPLFGGVISSLQARFEEARISDLNYELGKFVQDTKNKYLSKQSLRSKLPKSQTLPAFPQSRSFIFGKSSLDSSLNEQPQGKFVYRSSLRPPSEEDILGCEGLEEEVGNSLTDSTVVEKFIKVIESSSSATGKESKVTCNTREDIRKKLAFNSHCEGQAIKKADLEVCFINEIVDEDLAENEYQSLPSSTAKLPRSKSECVSIFRHNDECTDYTSVAYKLAKCKQDAHRKMIVERQNRKFHEVNTFNQLIGKSIEGDLNEEILSQMNTATLQVIVNDFHNKIEKLNEELVDELMRKDELQIEQDGMMTDIDDLRNQ